MTPSLLHFSSPFAHSLLRTRRAALGRFDDLDRTPSAFRPDIGPEDVCERLSASLKRRPDTPAVPPGPRAAQHGGARDTLERGATALVPEVDRDESFAVASAVDRLLDRHPRAELPKAILAGVDDLVRRAVSGSTGLVRAASAAALIVAVQRGVGADRVLLLSRTVSPRFSSTESSLVEVLARTAALAPATERAAVLVVLARLLVGDGRADEARGLAHDAVRLDPHHVGARRLAAALSGNGPGGTPARAVPPGQVA